jgi:glycosyltransferase involved in cell wall biosynthesis
MRREHQSGMRVGFDAHMVGQRETGNETYALGLLDGFQQIGFSVDTYALVPLSSSVHRNHRVWPRPSLLRVPIASPILTLRDDLSIFHGTYVLPPLLPCAGIVTVHDITFELHPEWFPERVRRMLSLLVPLTLRRASHVITISASTKRDISEQYGVPPEKITVTQLAPRKAFSDATSRRPSDEPFFLYVGNVEPRKNIATILRAMRIMHDRSVPARLAVVGKIGYHDAEIRQLVYELRLRGWVRFTGYLSDEQLKQLYSSCIALVHPALYEGFGLTPLEAMAQQVPVIASNTSSIPEVVGDAAILLDPRSPERWADTMELVMRDCDLQSSLATKGLQRARLFSWNRCARETVDVYRAVLDKGRG